MGSEVKLKITWETKDPTNQWNIPFCLPEFAHALKAHNVELVDRGQDLTLATLTVTEDIEGPTIIFMRADTSWFMPACHRWLDHPDVIGFAMPLVAADPHQSISQHVWHTSIRLTDKPVIPITGMLWQLLRGYAAYADELPEKTIDVLFVGTMHRFVHLFPEIHRSNLVKHWHTLSHYTSVACFAATNPFEYAIDPHETWQLIKKAKVIVSPWGVCEISARDYEACFAECMIVKPSQPDMDVMANPWHGHNTLYCQPDYSDLAFHVRSALFLRELNLDLLQKHRQRLLTIGQSLDVCARMFVEQLNRTPWIPCQS